MKTNVKGLSQGRDAASMPIPVFMVSQLNEHSSKTRVCKRGKAWYRCMYQSSLTLKLTMVRYVSVLMKHGEVVMHLNSV
jgi:hypothetical protein